MDLIGGYLLVILVLFAGNISLILGNFKFNTIKLCIVSLIFAVITFALLYSSVYLNASLSFLLDNFGYLFFIVFAVIFASILYYLKTDNFKIPLYSVLAIFLVSTVCLASQADLGILDMVLYSLFVFIVIFVVYQLSKLLHHAKREYPVIIGEYMCLFATLIFIFAATYNSARGIDYTAFSPFLILTPTYQLIYVVIGIFVILVIGVFLNDFKGGNS